MRLFIFMTIAFTGPESTGKTFLASKISHFYKATYIKEFARTYFEEIVKSSQYSTIDILKILSGHLKQLELVKESNRRLIVMDTDILVLKVWCNFKFGITLPEIESAWEDQKVDLYLLCYPDIPWVSDPLRENQFDRLFLFEEYLKVLNESQRNYQIIRGKGEERIENVKQILSPLIGL